MASGNLYNETLRSAMCEPRTEPRESKAWLGWLVAGLIAGGGVVDVWHMYEERLARDERYRMTGAKPDDNSPTPLVPEGKAPSSTARGAR